MADEGIYSLLAKAQAAMASPKKNGVGQIGTRKYAYATLDDVLDAIKPPLNENGLFLTQRTVNGENCLFIQTIVGHGSETLLLDEEPYEYDPNPQEYGKRETYAKRYGLCKAFAIVGDEDTDGDVQQTAPQDPRWKTTGTAKAAQTAKAQPDKKKWLTRCLQLKAQCMAQGVKESGLDSWYKASFGDVQPGDLTLGQVTEWGKYLAQIAKDSDHSKEETDEHQSSDD